LQRLDLVWKGLDGPLEGPGGSYKARLSLEMAGDLKKGKREEKMTTRGFHTLKPCEKYKTLEDLVY